MKPMQAGMAGILTGLLFGAAICLIQNISIADASFRIVILASAGGWMGVLLAWLNQLLPSKTNQQTEHTDTGA